MEILQSHHGLQFELEHFVEASLWVGKLNSSATRDTFCGLQSLSGHVSELAVFDRGIKSTEPNGIMASGYQLQTKEHSIHSPDQMLGCWENQ